MTTTTPLAARLSALIDELDAHVTGTPDRTIAAIAADLDDLQDDVARLERSSPPAEPLVCIRCRLGNHTGTNGTDGCVGDFCTCPCRAGR